MSLWPGTSSASSCNTRHNTHGAEVREVLYPWHPFFGREVFILEHLHRAGRPVSWCSLEPETQGRRFEIPDWMFDRACCSRMQLSTQSRVCWSALVELRELLDRTACAEPSTAVELQHRPLKGGDADAEAFPTTGATGTLPATEDSTGMEDAPHRCSPDSDSVVGQDSPRPSRAAAAKAKEQGRTDQ